MGSGQWFGPFTSSLAQAHFRGGMTRPACEGTQCWTGGQTGNAPLNIISCDPQRSRVGRWTPAGQPRVAVLKRGCGEKEMVWSVLLLYLSLLRHLNFHKNPPIGQAVPNDEWKEWVYVHCSPFWIIWFSTEHTLPYDNRGKTGIKWWFYVEFLQNFYKELHEMGGLEFFWKKKNRQQNSKKI